MADDFDANEFLTDLGINPEEDAGDSTGIKMLRKKVKELGKQLSEANKQIETFQAEKAQGALKATWDELGVPEPIRGFYKGDQNPDEIKSWWEASKGFFNITAGEGSSGDGNTAATDGPASGDVAALRQVQRAASLGHDKPTDLSADAFMAEAQKVKGTSASGNPNALAELLTKFGIPGGTTAPPRMG